MRHLISNRRSALRTGGIGALGFGLAGAGGLHLAGTARADNHTGGGMGQAPGFYRYQVGERSVTAVTDGGLQLPAGLLAPSAPEDTVTGYLEDNLQSTETVNTQMNQSVIEDGDGFVLFDVGAGERGQSPSLLFDHLAQAGISPEQITRVVFTHLHFDHFFGLTTAEANELRFPNAEIVIPEPEHAFWAAEETLNEVPEQLRDMVQGVQNILGAVAQDRLRLINDGDEVAAGVTAMATPGHTPGHTSYRLDDGEASVLIAGDVFNHPVFLAHPDFAFGFDYVPDQAVETRMRVLDMLNAERMPVQTYHLTWPGIGLIRREGDAYGWVASGWNWQL